MAFEQRGTKLFLQPLDRPAQSRLRHMEDLCCATEAAAFDNRRERMKLLKTKGHDCWGAGGKWEGRSTQCPLAIKVKTETCAGERGPRVTRCAIHNSLHVVRSLIFGINRLKTHRFDIVLDVRR